MEKKISGKESLKRAMRLPVSVLLAVLFSLFLALSLSGCSGKSGASRKTVYIAWSNNQESTSFLSTLRAVEAAGAEPVVLDMARSADLTYDEAGNLTDTEDAHGILTPEAAKLVKNNTWQNSNVEEIMENVSGVIFPGGADISPTMYYDEQAWHEITEDTAYSAERDVSDYLLLSYCLENDIPVLAICRGMQMLSVVSGADMIQDLSQCYEAQGRTYHYLHRDPEKKAFVPIYDCRL